MNRRHFIASQLALGLWAMHARIARAASAPDIPLANNYRQEIDPAAYWVSEKLDGVRGLWDGKTLRFRSGNIVSAPDWFLAALPPLPLDGELWLGRRSFEQVSALLRKGDPADPAWRELRYMIFELPDAAGDFSTRLAQIRQIAARSGQAWLQAHTQFRVADRAALDARLQQVLREGGEGLVLHRADAPYLGGRSDALLKLKPQLDAEALVVAHLPGKGRNAGRLGALLVETPEGQRFRLGSGLSDRERDNPPAIGSRISYRYRDLTAKGLPRFASYLRPADSF
ncbi:DNA ligase [Uliginosibacterium sediminicola]|uniref:DNA ligase n=1 Tax=Uliginosibacterium sediminicola TaxID=2024550 RepID=A0ABU9YZM9_9RHOO